MNLEEWRYKTHHLLKKNNIRLCISLGNRLIISHAKMAQTIMCVAFSSSNEILCILHITSLFTLMKRIFWQQVYDKNFDTCNEMQHHIHHIVPYITWKKENSILVKTRSFIILKKENIVEFNDYFQSVSHQRQFLCLVVPSKTSFMF